MDEYIARNTAKRWLAFAVGTGVSAAETIDQVPAADVVEVVRCKECKHYNLGVCLKIYSDGNAHTEAWQPRKPEDFCSYGARKDRDNAEG